MVSHKNIANKFLIILSNYVNTRTMSGERVVALKNQIFSEKLITPAIVYRSIHHALKSNPEWTGITAMAAVAIIAGLQVKCATVEQITDYQSAVACFVVDYWNIPKGDNGHAHFFSKVVEHYNKPRTIPKQLGDVNAAVGSLELIPSGSRLTYDKAELLNVNKLMTSHMTIVDKNLGIPMLGTVFKSGRAELI